MENNNNTGIIITIVAILVIIGGIAFAGMYSKDDSMKKDEITNTQNMNNNNDIEKGVMVGGAMMVPSKDIVENAMNAKNVKSASNTNRTMAVCKVMLVAM